ncbi:MAG: hypothetical protein KJ914_13070 [Gammaproteobacteria bacterium]|nr:hypothetical protein [Gammaproteobacteria bacterium]MBU1724861.1 hypothetical protein [Gammaproteobacteria bacterium]MBU2005045.1 hypothetical protein [Gammaproteobacteria bacterium]
MESKFDNEIVFVTGLSVDKKTLNELYSNITDDKIFSEYLAEIKRICLSKTYDHGYMDLIKEGLIGRSIDSAKEIKIKTIKNTCNENNDFNISDFLKNSIGDHGESLLSTYTGSLVGKVMKFLSEKWSKESGGKILDESIFYDNFERIILSNSFILNQIKNSRPVDYFNIYLSNQSDARAVPAVSKLISQRDSLKTHWAYCDRPFYKNKFINYIKINFNNDKLKNKTVNKLLLSQYIIHGIDIVISKNIEKFSNLDKESFSQDSTYNKAVKFASQRFIKEFGKSISERSFFGIDLLSRIIKTLLFYKKLLGKKDDNLIISLSKELNEEDRSYYRELVESASDPSEILIEDEDNLVKNNANKSTDNSRKGLYEKNQRKTSLEVDITINNFNTSSYDYKYSDSDIIMGKVIEDIFISDKFILVPIKLFLSLPLKVDLTSDGNPVDKVCQQQLLPDLVTTDNSDTDIEVIACGGIEHNRPLMHLINAHRKKMRNKRLFGFLDNHFDFEHRWNNEHEYGFDHMFIMGVAQPVSGFNQILIKRFDDKFGNSISLEAKNIIFQVDCPKLKRKVTVLSIYGFSAIATVLATLRIISKILTAIKLRKEKLLENSISIIDGDYSDVDSGYTWRVEFSVNAENKMYQVSGDIDPFSIITSPNYQETSQKLIDLFIENERHGGIVKKVTPARTLSIDSKG